MKAHRLLLLTCGLLALTACEPAKEPSPSPKKEVPIMPEVEATLVEGCSLCHGSDGVNSRSDTPFIAGQSVTYLESAMHQYLILDRKHEVMRQAVLDLDVEQRQQLAKHFSSLTTPWKGDKKIQAQNSRAPDPAAVRAGKTISRSCSSCHGKNGNSIKEGVPSISGLQPVYFVPAVKAYLSGARRGAAIMKNFKLSLSEKDINNLAAYYSVQQREKSPLSTKLQATVPSDALVERCVGCHGEDGNSTHPAMPTLSGQNATYLIKAMKKYRDGKRANKMMVDIAKDLSDDDIEQNAAYFATRIPAKINQPSPVKKTVAKFDPLGDGATLAASCNGCHGTNGNHPQRGTPRLAGLHTTYLQKAISDYRDGKRKHPMMKMLARYLSETDIEKISLYYGNQTPEKSKHNLKNANSKKGQGLASSCTGCHGEDGNSQDAKVPSLAGQGPAYLVTAINSYQDKGSRTHKDMKGAVEALTKKDVFDLAQYFSQLEPKSNKPRTMEGPDTLSKKCDRCHGEEGGNPDSKKPRIAGQRQSYIETALNAYKRGDRTHSMMRAMSEELWTVEIEAIAAHYAKK